MKQTHLKGKKKKKKRVGTVTGIRVDTIKI